MATINLAGIHIRAWWEWANWLLEIPLAIGTLVTIA